MSIKRKGFFGEESYFFEKYKKTLDRHNISTYNCFIIKSYEGEKAVAIMLSRELSDGARQ